MAMNQIFKAMVYFIFIEVIIRLIAFSKLYSKSKKLLYVAIFTTIICIIQINNEINTSNNNLYNQMKIQRKSYDFDNCTEIVDNLMINLNSSLLTETERLSLERQINAVINKTHNQHYEKLNTYYIPSVSKDLDASKIDQEAIIKAAILYWSTFFVFIIAFSHPKGTEIKVITYMLFLFFSIEILLLPNKNRK